MCPPIFWRTAGAWHSPAKWSLFTPSFQLQTRGMPLNLDHKEIFGLCFYLPLRSILSNKISRMLLIWSRDSHMLLLWSRDCHLFIIFLWKKKKKNLPSDQSRYSSQFILSWHPDVSPTLLFVDISFSILECVRFSVCKCRVCRSRIQMIPINILLVGSYFHCICDWSIYPSEFLHIFILILLQVIWCP